MKKKRTVFVVVFSNYPPAQVKSIHETPAGAEAACPGGLAWHVEEWEVLP